MKLPIVRLGDRVPHGGVVVIASVIHTLRGTGVTPKAIWSGVRYRDMATTTS
jgi:hypothetical protein